MRCPRDGHEMLHETFGPVEVDICPQCAGVWFDAHEFAKFDDAIESAGAELVARLDELRLDSAPIDTSARLTSPVDPEVVMMRRFADPEGTIELDECPVSGGLWLDAGELAALRTRFPDQRTRDEATQVVIDRVMSCANFQAARAKEAADAGNAERAARVLDWLTPWRSAA